MAEKKRSIMDDIDEIEADEKSGKLEKEDIDIEVFEGFADGGAVPRSYPGLDDADEAK